MDKFFASHIGLGPNEVATGVRPRVAAPSVQDAFEHTMHAPKRARSSDAFVAQIGQKIQAALQQPNNGMTINTAPMTKNSSALHPFDEHVIIKPFEEGWHTLIEPYTPLFLSRSDNDMARGSNWFMGADIVIMNSLLGFADKNVGQTRTGNNTCFVLHTEKFQRTDDAHGTFLPVTPADILNNFTMPGIVSEFNQGAGTHPSVRFSRRDVRQVSFTMMGQASVYNFFAPDVKCGDFLWLKIAKASSVLPRTLRTPDGVTISQRSLTSKQLMITGVATETSVMRSTKEAVYIKLGRVLHVNGASPTQDDIDAALLSTNAMKQLDQRLTILKE